MLKLEVNNVNIKIIGDLTTSVVNKLSTSMTYKTNEFNGYTFVVLEHNLFNRIKQTFPTGLYSNAAAVLDSYNLNYDVIDKRIEASKNKSIQLHEVTPHEFQKKIIADAIDSQRFVIQVATGGGKTVIAAAILAQLNVPSIFVVHTGDLFEQSYDELKRMLKIPIGRIGGGLCDIRQINVCMIQTIHAVIGKEYIPFDDVEKDQMENDEIVKKSVLRNKQIEEFLQKVQCILVDECHHLRSNSYVSVMKVCKSAYFKGGLSATPESGDGRDMILQAYAGKIIGKITASYLIKHGYLVRPTIYYLRGSKNESYKFSRKRYNSIYKTYIVNNKYRNGLIVDCVKRLVDLGKTVLITVTLKRHGRLLLELLKKDNIDVQFICGGVDKLKRKEYIEQVRKRQLSVIVGTSLADEGLNIPALDSLILAGSGKSPTRQIQRIGRVLRRADGKTEAIVIDFKDCVRYLTGHYKKRRTICESESEFKIVETFN